MTEHPKFEPLQKLHWKFTPKLRIQTTLLPSDSTLPKLPSLRLSLAALHTLTRHPLVQRRSKLGIPQRDPLHLRSKRHHVGHRPGRRRLPRSHRPLYHDLLHYRTSTSTCHLSPGTCCHRSNLVLFPATQHSTRTVWSWRHTTIRQ